MNFLGNFLSVSDNSIVTEEVIIPTENENSSLKHLTPSKSTNKKINNHKTTEKTPSQRGNKSLQISGI